MPPRCDVVKNSPNAKVQPKASVRPRISTFSTTPEGAPVKDENPRPDRLEQALDERALEHTPGFFFGGDEIHPDDVADTREFITQARAALADGLAVFYDCWW